MDEDKHERYHRPALRLPDYDYGQAGAYFVTLCVQERNHLFGDVVNGEMRLNYAGQMVAQWWNEITNNPLKWDLDPSHPVNEPEW